MHFVSGAPLIYREIEIAFAFAYHRTPLLNAAGEVRCILNATTKWDPSI
jgi:hypothetical protein